MKSISIFLVVALSLALSTIAVVHCEHTKERIQRILNIANTERSSVSPPAANMREMRWSSCLAEVVEKHLQTCPDIGVKNPNLQKEAKEAGCEAADVGIGEIMYEVPSDGSYSIGKDECISCMDDNGDCDDECERYFQVINAESYSVGCVLRPVECGGAEGTGTCYFSVPTNSDGPYIEGEPCSRCVGEWSGCNEAGLCTQMKSPTESPTGPHDHHNQHNHHDHGRGHKSHDHNHGTKHDHAHKHKNGKGNDNGDMGGQMSVGRFVGSSSSSASINKIAILLLIASLFAFLFSSL